MRNHQEDLTMTWFAFKGYNDGQAIDLAGVQEKIAVGWRFHG